MLAASKTVGIDAIQAALGAGHRLFGESRAQELRDVRRQLAEHPCSLNGTSSVICNAIKLNISWGAYPSSTPRTTVHWWPLPADGTDGHTQPMPVLVEVNLEVVEQMVSNRRKRWTYAQRFTTIVSVPSRSDGDSSERRSKPIDALF